MFVLRLRCALVAAIQQFDLAGTLASKIKSWGTVAERAKKAAETASKLDNPIPKGARAAADAAKVATGKVMPCIRVFRKACLHDVERPCAVSMPAGLLALKR